MILQLNTVNSRLADTPQAITDIRCYGQNSEVWLELLPLLQTQNESACYNKSWLCMTFILVLQFKIAVDFGTLHAVMQLFIMLLLYCYQSWRLKENLKKYWYIFSVKLSAHR